MRSVPISRLAAIALCAWAGAASAAQPLETLFHTPQEREHLDRLRRGEVTGATLAGDPVRSREITGYVKRSDGRGTAFIDGVPVPVDKQGTTLLEPGAVRAYADRPSENLRIERKDGR